MNNLIINRSKQSNQLDSSSAKGIFGWESVNAGVVIPVIYRNGQKYAAYKILQWYIFPHFYSNDLHADLKMFEFMPKNKMTNLEAILFNEINHVHCDSKYNITFKENDLIVSVDDIRTMLDYLELIYKKLILGPGLNATNFGLIQMQADDRKGNNLIMPYIKRNGTILIPCGLLKGKPALKNLNKVCMTGIEMQYLKFLYRVMKIKTKQSKMCVLWSDYVEKTSVKYREFWPESRYYEYLLTTVDSVSSTVDDISDEYPSITCENNNNPADASVPLVDEQLLVQTQTDPDPEPANLHQTVEVC